jgi:hypothetical protein
MTDRLQIKDHLRNGVLYRPVTEPSPGGEWKRRLLRQHALRQQLQTALREKSRFPKGFVCIGVPILCITLAFSLYFGFIHPEHWLENIIPVVNFDIPPIGLKEALVFVAIVNGLTLLVRKRAVLLG